MQAYEITGTTAVMVIFDPIDELDFGVRDLVMLQVRLGKSWGRWWWLMREPT
ncbi:hypothetical protein [Nitrospirillum amazonense]|uniref:hypothetical protein n=1 Tax=Nitrospirillum amazonense TaxID=28077 RepID=UPI001646384E|nr:hypothetical protein [Nitrospirillum amazonense]